MFFQDDVHPEVRYRNVVRNLNVLLDLAAGVSCGVFLMLALAQRAMSKSSRQYTHFDFQQEHINVVSLFLMMELCKHYVFIGLEKIRDRAAREVLIHHITCTPDMGDVMQFCLSEVGHDPFSFPDNNPAEVHGSFKKTGA